MAKLDERVVSAYEAEVERRAVARARGGQGDLLALQRRTAEALERIAELLAKLVDGDRPL